MHKTHCRFRRYGYEREGAMFVTTGLEPRRPLFGRVDHECVMLSAVGEIVRMSDGRGYAINDR